MAKALPAFENVESWEDLCRRFGDLLDLGEPAPLAVVRRAMQDDQFAQYLMMTRSSPRLLKTLLQDPRNKQYEGPPEEIRHTTPALAASAAKAMLKWSTSGFARVDQETLDTRLSACQRCEYLIDPPPLAAYRMLKLAGDRRVCAKCGCVASRKAQVATERCPERDPSNPAQNRWGQPLG